MANGSFIVTGSDAPLWRAPNWSKVDAEPEFGWKSPDWSKIDEPDDKPGDIGPISSRPVALVRDKARFFAWWAFDAQLARELTQEVYQLAVKRLQFPLHHYLWTPTGAYDARSASDAFRDFAGIVVETIGKLAAQGLIDRATQQRLAEAAQQLPTIGREPTLKVPVTEWYRTQNAQTRLIKGGRAMSTAYLKQAGEGARGHPDSVRHIMEDLQRDELAELGREVVRRRQR
jgi:hypothetical protein